jgi:arylsulfatase A-like enzyme
MHRNPWPLILAGLLVATACRSTGGIAPEAPSPPLNVLFIMSDQHSAQALGCYDNEEVLTPNLDRLAAEGMRFESAFCQTGQCCPSRYTIWTGRYARTHGLRWNGVVENLDEITVGELFRDAGYVTGTIGKHHMQYDPIQHGFDRNWEMSDYGPFVAAEGTDHCWGAGDWMPVDSAITAGPAGTSAADNDHHFSGFFANRAIEFLREHEEQPFCLWLSFYGPHVPWVASRPWMERYDAEALHLPPSFGERREGMPKELERMQQLFAGLEDRDFREFLRCYYALISQIDFNIGRVLDELEHLGLAENTIVVYTSDHGEMMGEHGVFRKAVLGYDATTRVPLIVRWPARIGGGITVNELVGSIDLLPTLCEAARIPCPEGVQGRSLLPLASEQPVEWREVIFSEIGYPLSGLPYGLCISARTKDLKYIRNDNGGEMLEELFDLRSDPGETVNLAGDPGYAEALDGMRRATAEWEEATAAAPLFPIEEFRRREAPPAR